MGLGGFPGDHPLWLGMLGMHGTYCANMAVSHADVLIAVGARFDDRVTGKCRSSPRTPRSSISTSTPRSISKNVQVDIPIVGDCKDTLGQLNELLEDKPVRDWTEMPPALARAPINELEAPTHPLTYVWDDKVIKPQYVVEKLYELTKGEAIITTEVGQNQMWAAQFYQFEQPRPSDDLRGAGGHGLRASRRPSGPRWPARTTSSSTSPATAASR